MNATLQNQATQWLRAASPLRGTLVNGIRFADETFVTPVNVNPQEFTAAALETMWRAVADAFEVLRVQHLPPTRLTWVYKNTTLHCVQRADGPILSVVLTRKDAEADLPGLDRLLAEFQTQSVAAV